LKREGRQNGAGAVARPLPTLALSKFDGCLEHHRELLASLGQNEGFLTASSSPAVFWLAAALEGKIR
jgi:hypothetical protein